MPTSSAEPADRSRPTVSVVVPCLNEERNLPYVFERMPTDVDEVIVVDGGSVDRTVERTYELWPSAKVVQQSRRGKGNALVCGFDACTGDIIVMIDADGSTDPGEIPRFVDTLRAGADFAKGSRFLPSGGSHDITRTRRLGNSTLSATVNVLFGTQYSDLCYGYNAFWRWVVPYLDLPGADAPAPASGGMLRGDGFEIETLISIRAAALGLRVSEVASVEAARIHGVSNLSAFRDGQRVLRTILRERRHARAYRSQRPTRPLPPVTSRPVEAGSGSWSSISDDVLAPPRPMGMPALMNPPEDE
jgi:glycosyltransferase involved in cell wall biosynthesis